MTDVRCLDLTLPTPAENLACDEALLEWCEAGNCAHAILRFWEPPQTFIVLGYANRVEDEVDLAAAESAKAPIFRRCSGGGAVVQSPGCLNYTLLHRIDGQLESITETNCRVMKRNAAALQRLLGKSVEVRGHTDLAIGDMKVSGYAQRRKRHWLLFHGTFLCHADLAMMDRILKHPPKEPDYRKGRGHRQFVTTIGVSSRAIKEAMCQAWNATEIPGSLPTELMAKLVAEKYSTDAWNLKW